MKTDVSITEQKKKVSLKYGKTNSHNCRRGEHSNNRNFTNYTYRPEYMEHNCKKCSTDNCRSSYDLELAQEEKRKIILTSLLAKKHPQASQPTTSKSKNFILTEDSFQNFCTCRIQTANSQQQCQGILQNGYYIYTFLINNETPRLNTFCELSVQTVPPCVRSSSQFPQFPHS